MEEVLGLMNYLSPVGFIPSEACMLPQAVQFFCYEDKQELPYLLCRLALHCVCLQVYVCVYEFGLRLLQNVHCPFISPKSSHGSVGLASIGAAPARYQNIVYMGISFI